MHFLRTIPTTIAGVIGLMALGAVSGCGRGDQASSRPAASANASASAEASASDAQAASALARANAPAAGTVANAKGENQKGPPPTVSVAEQAQAVGAEAPHDLRDKVNAAKDVGLPQDRRTRAPAGQ
ncbi:MAG TPA: hypothetical protein VGM25_10335 [Caulobacteraceae bacterium]|jgi:hypothetical protein